MVRCWGFKCFGGMVSSICGGDAHYREVFYECEEGLETPEASLLARVREQVDLKKRKSSLFVSFVTFELWRGISCVGESTTNCDAVRALQLRASQHAQSVGGRGWFGTTIKEIKEHDGPRGEGLFWYKATGIGTRWLRAGPNYPLNKGKIDATCSLYECVSFDAIKSNTVIEDIIGRLVDRQELPASPDVKWTPACGLPRIICLNVKLPYNVWTADSGCSYVSIFRIKPETFAHAMAEKPPAGVGAFQRFFKGPAGLPQGSKNDPNRHLRQRLVKGLTKDRCPGLFKVIADCENLDAISVPQMAQKFNGKPVVIADCGSVVRDPELEWLEIGIDVRGFNITARKGLQSWREQLPMAKLHFGCVIQEVADPELPEALLCDLFVNGVDIVNQPVMV